MELRRGGLGSLFDSQSHQNLIRRLAWNLRELHLRYAGVFFQLQHFVVVFPIAKLVRSKEGRHGKFNDIVTSKYFDFSMKLGLN